MLGRSPLGATIAILGVAAATAVAYSSADADPASASRSAPGVAANWRPDVAAARRYAFRRAGRVSFDVIDTRGRERGFRARAGAPMASVFKVMLLAAYLRRPAVRGRRLHGSDRALLVPMIRRSDNAAATRVRDIVGVGAIKRLARRARMRRGRQRIGLAIFTRSNPSHGYGKRTLEGVARRLLRGLPPG